MADGKRTQNGEKDYMQDGGPGPSPEELQKMLDAAAEDVKKMVREQKEESQVNPRNGVSIHDDEQLPPLQQKIDEAEAILAQNKLEEEQSRSKDHKKGRESR